MKAMKSRRVLLLCSLCFLWVAGAFSFAHGQDRDQAFDPVMSLEETMDWLGKQLTHQHSVVSPDGKSVWQRGTRLVKAKGCTLSYWATIQTDGLEPVSPSYQRRELWVLDLSDLDPETILSGASGRVSFTAAASARDAIRTSVFRNETSLSAYSNKRWGYFSVREKVATEDVAAGLRHAVELCRQRRQ